MRADLGIVLGLKGGYIWGFFLKGRFGAGWKDFRRLNSRVTILTFQSWHKSA